MALTTEEIVAAINTVDGITAEGLAALLGRSVLLTQIESKRAEIVRKQQEITAIQADYGQRFADLQSEQQAAQGVLTAQMQVLQAELDALVARANQAL